MTAEKAPTKKKVPKIKEIKKPIIVGGMITVVAIAGIVIGIVVLSEVEEEERGGTLIIGLYERFAIDQIDPFNSFWHSRLVVSQVVESLFDISYSNNESVIIPNLATGFDWNDNATEFTCYLRQGVKFHDGSTFDASVVKWNFDRIYRLDFASMYYILLLPDGRPIVNETIVVDDYTVKFVLNAPFVPFHALLTANEIGFVSPTATPSDTFLNVGENSLVGTGPFIFDDIHLSHNITLISNPNYWGVRPKIENITFSIYSPARNQTRDDVWEAMLTKEITLFDPYFFNNFYSPDYPLGWNISLQVFKSNANFTVHDSVGDLYRYVGMDNQIIDVTMRKAISYAIDYSYAVEDMLIYGAKRSRSPIPDYVLYYNVTDLDVPYYNVSIARQVLKDGGWPGTASLTVNGNTSVGNEWEKLVDDRTPLATYNMTYFHWNPIHTQVAILVEENLKQIGVNVSRVGYHGDYPEDPLYKLGWYMDYNDPHNILFPLYYSSLSDNEFKFNDSLIDQWIEEGIRETDPSLRRQIYYQIQERIIEDLYPLVWIITEKQIFIHLSNLKGLQPNPFKISFKTVYFD